MSSLTGGQAAGALASSAVILEAVQVATVTKSMQLVFAALLSTTTTRRLAIGIDVGTGSARAGVVDVTSGALLATHKRDIKTWSPKPDYFEQSTEDVWAACAECVRTSLAMAGASASDVIGIGFDATCSLVCVDSENKPVGVDPGHTRDNGPVL
jgi:ribulose kinase